MSDSVLTADFVARLRAFVRKRVRSDEDAEDITQNALLKFVQDRESVAENSGPAWVFTVARREIIDRFRRADPTTFELADSHIASDGDQEPSTLQDLAHCVDPLLQCLSGPDRDVLRRVDLLGESQAEIADALGLPRSTIKARTQRARLRFHQALLSCCAIELDARGGPVSYSPANGTECPCTADSGLDQHPDARCSQDQGPGSDGGASRQRAPECAAADRSNTGCHTRNH